MNSLFNRRFILLFFALCWAFVSLSQPPCDDDDDEITGTLSYSGPVCSGGTVTITITLDDDDDDDNELYDVTYSIGGNSFFLNDISNGASVNHTVTTTVMATLISIYDNANDCIVVINSSIVVAVFPQPSMAISNIANPGCGQNNGSITATAAGGAPPYQYSINGGAFQSGGVFSGLPAGSYTITVRDANNCTDSSGAIQLNDSGTLQLQVFTSSPANCSQQNGSLTLQAVGGMPPYQYSINGVNYQTSNVFNNLASGSYQIHVRDASGCIAVIPVEIGNTASTLTAATVAAGAITACPGELTLAIGNRPNGTTGVWSSTDSEINFNTPSSPQTIVSATSAGIYTLIWTLSAPGCPAYSSAQVVLTVPMPPAAYDDIEQVAAGQSLILQTALNDDNVSEAIFSIIRQPALGFAAIDAATGELDYAPNPNTSGFDTLYYTLCLPPCDGQLCDTAAVVIQIVTEDCSLEAEDNVFPEGITPNGDGYNDQLHFVVIDKSTCPYNYARSELIIYNRWGDRVLEASPYDNDWDGTNLPHGVYYYVLKVHLEQEFVKFGNVTIFRD